MRQKPKWEEYRYEEPDRWFDYFLLGFFLMLFVLVVQSLVSSKTLEGSVSNAYGRVGVRIALDGGISHVYSHSPAFGVLFQGQKVVAADGVKGHDHVDGMAGTTAALDVEYLDCGKKVVVRKYIVRVPKEEVYDDVEIK